MTIKPVHFNGMMQRSQDVSNLKHNEEQRPIIQQENIQTSFERRTQNVVKTVTHSEEKQDANGHFDAKEEGRNKYFFNRKKGNKAESKDQVVKKNSTSGFDVTV